HLGEYERARQELARVLEVDSRHREAGELMTKIHRALALEQRQKRALNLRVRAEEALNQNRVSEAFSFIEQALRLDRDNPELRSSREKIRVKEKVNQALLRAERSLPANRLEEAMRAVEEGMRLARESVRAKFLKVMMEAKLDEPKPFRAETADFEVKPKRSRTT